MMPNWIIVGAPKAGTSSLFQWLVDHPQVGGSREKETYYFVDPGTHMYRQDRNFAQHGVKGYEALFSHCDPAARVVLEATPGYMYYETALTELPRLPTRPNFIFLLREPVAQLRSLHRYFQQNWDWVPRSMSFAEFVDAAERGDSNFKGNELAAGALRNACYIDQMRRWRDACGPERLHVLLFESLLEDPRQFMAETAQRLGIDPSFYDSYDYPIENESYVARSATLQSLNIRLRGMIPQGRVYHALRRIYRAANTRKASASAVRVDLQDLAAERMLSQRYMPMLDDLETEFGLDLARWRHRMEARLARTGLDKDRVDSLSTEFTATQSSHLMQP